MNFVDENLLHILRNPAGFSDAVVREARLRAAYKIERLEAKGVELDESDRQLFRQTVREACAPIVADLRELPFPLKWRPMIDPPPIAGRFIVAHRGGIGGSAVYGGGSPGFSEWSQVPDFGPTHWIEAPK